MNKRFQWVAIVATCASFVAATDYLEAEPNGTRAQANQFSGLVAGDRILGSLTAADDDFFRATMAAKPTGIWLSRIQLTLPGGGDAIDHNAHMWGLVQTNGTIGTTATEIQHSLPSTGVKNTLQWYGFGKSESLYFNVDSPATPGDYVATLTQTQIAPTVIAPFFQEGAFTITTVGQTGATQTDTDMWLYDANFNAISGAGNDDASTTTLGSTLSRSLTAGTYYLAISNFNLANNMASPADDSYRSGAVTDFPNILVGSSPSGEDGADNISFRISNQWDTFDQAAFKTNAFEVQFYQITVVPEPGTMAILALGGLGLIARKRRGLKNR